MRLSGLIILGFAISMLQAQDTLSTIVVSDAIVHVVRHAGSRPGPLYYNMHDDENTSVEAMDTILSTYGGVLFELCHTGNRNITFHLDSIEYEFDPNRIYTTAGIWKEIRKVHARDSARRMEVAWKLMEVLIRNGILPDPNMNTFNEQDSADLNNNINLSSAVEPNPIVFTATDSVAFEMIRMLSDSLLSLMAVDSQQIVITLHNNREEGYSMASYRIDSIYQTEALAVYIGWHHDPDEFYFVTDRRLYEALQPNNYHIVLQDNSLMTDDGSLSVYCGQRGIAYINVEAQHGHLGEQIEMLMILNDRLFKADPQE